MTVLLSGLFFWMTGKAEFWAWLILPISLVLDLWGQKPLGSTGIKIAALTGLFWLLFPGLFKKEGRIKL